MTKATPRTAKNVPKKKAPKRPAAPTGTRRPRAVDQSPPVDAVGQPVDAGPKTEGQRQLVALADTSSAIARKVGASKQVVSCWRKGQKIPAAEARAKIDAEYGIPPPTWDQVPKGESQPGRASIPVSALSTKSTLEEIVEVQRMVETLAYNAEISPIVRVKFVDPLMKVLALKARVEREREFLEDRIVREHPEFARLTKALFEALRPWPDALRASREALRQA